MKEIKAYQASDGTKFLREQEAEVHEDRLRCKAKVEEIENYLFDLLGIKGLSDTDGESREGQLAAMLIGEEGTSGLWEDAIELEIITELIIDVATIFDGALLKTAQYAKKIISLDKTN